MLPDILQLIKCSSAFLYRFGTSLIPSANESLMLGARNNTKIADMTNE